MRLTHPCRRTCRAGFTLVELLVVIALVALLASMIAPALSRARQTGDAARCLGNLRTLGALAGTAMADNGGIIPRGRGFSPPFWLDELKIPNWRGTVRGDNALKPVPPNSCMVCPAERGKNGWKTSWGGNYTYNRAYGNEWDRTNGIRMASIAKPSQKVLIVDGAFPDPWNFVFNVTPLDREGHVAWDRHGRTGDGLGRFHVLWLDGHASAETGMNGSDQGTLPMTPEHYDKWLP